MKTTIDAAGRVVIPKKLRDKAGLTPGTKLDVRLDNGVIEIEPEPVEVKLVREGNFLVLHYEGNVPPLTSEDVERMIEEVRDERFKDFLGG